MIFKRNELTISDNQMRILFRVDYGLPSYIEKNISNNPIDIHNVTVILYEFEAKNEISDEHRNHNK